MFPSAGDRLPSPLSGKRGRVGRRRVLAESRHAHPSPGSTWTRRPSRPTAEAARYVSSRVHFASFIDATDARPRSTSSRMRIKFDFPEPFGPTMQVSALFELKRDIVETEEVLGS